MDGTPDDNFALSSVFSQSYFEIPDYQRDYAWEKRNVKDLLDDIEFVYKQNNKTERDDSLDHYFGTFVLEDRGSVEPTDYEDYNVYGIVDGQQRLATIAIIISAIVDEMSDLESDQDVNEDFRSTISEERDKISESYIEYKGIDRIRLGGLGKSAYKQVIVGDRTPKEFLEQDNLVEAERKIARAKQVSLDRLQEWREDRFESDELEYAPYYKFLNKLVQILTQRLEVNIKVVEDVDEAARMFKVINDRGRDLRLHDKIRSHLVYCASQSATLESEDIYSQFNDIVRNITVHDGFSDSEVDDLARIHWEVFTSERSDSRAKRPGPSDIHRRLSEFEDFASVQRDDFESFIVPYLDSLETFSEYYPNLTDRDKFADEYFEPQSDPDSSINETVRRIQLLFLHSSVQSATVPLLIATADKFGVKSDEFADVTSELEKLVFGFSLVMSHGAQGFKNTLSSIANDLYWSEIEASDVQAIFNSDNQRYVGYSYKEVGVRKSIDRIMKKRRKITPIEDVITDFLSAPDVLDGSFTSGWGGVRNSEVIKYIMYEYERDLRGPSGLLSLSPYHEFRKNFDVEHLVPKNAEEGNKFEDHESNRNRIGNLAVLSATENMSEGNNSYESKYENIYRESSLNVLRELDGPNFTEKSVIQRGDGILEFVKRRWE